VDDFGPAKTLAIPMNEVAYSRSGFLIREIRALRVQRVVDGAIVLRPAAGVVFHHCMHIEERGANNNRHMPLCIGETVTDRNIRTLLNHLRELVTDRISEARDYAALLESAGLSR
jgi:hypothetical protein